MAKRTDARPHANVNRQIRGERLDRRIEAVIRELAAHAKATGAAYVYNASEVAKGVPCTRKTLARHDATVEKVLADLASRRRMVTGEATAEHLRDQVARLREQLAERDKTIQSLRAAHVEIYTRFHNQSLPAALLIQPILETESKEAGHCILCGAALTKPDQAVCRGNVVDIKSKPPRARR